MFLLAFVFRNSLMGRRHWLVRVCLVFRARSRESSLKRFKTFLHCIMAIKVLLGKWRVQMLAVVVRFEQSFWNECLFNISFSNSFHTLITTYKVDLQTRLSFICAILRWAIRTMGRSHGRASEGQVQNLKPERLLRSCHGRLSLSGMQLAPNLIQPVLYNFHHLHFATSK